MATTLKDILVDLAGEIVKNEKLDPEYQCDPKVIVEEYCEMISERIVGIVTRPNQLSL